MTDREQFESAAFNLRPATIFVVDHDGNYEVGSTAIMWTAWQAAKATCPAWHDAPTVPGLWVSDFSWMAQKLDRDTVEFYAKNRSIPSRRWYGPIPEDKQ